MLIISVMFHVSPLRLSVPSYWSSLHPLTSHPEAPGGGLIDRPVVCRDNTPPTSLVARVTDGFSLPKHFISISVTSDWWARWREEGRMRLSQSYASHDKRQRYRQTVYSECSLMFINETVSRSLSHSAQHQSCTLFSRLEHELTQKACQCLWGPVLWFTIIIFLHSDLSTVFWLPGWWKGVCDLKPTRTGQKIAWRKLLLQLKRQFL